MRGDVLTFKFSFSIGLLCKADSFVLRNPARTQSVGTLPAKLKKTTVQTKERIDKLKIKNQIQDIRVIRFYSSDLTNQQTRTCNHLNLYIMDTS